LAVALGDQNAFIWNGGKVIYHYHIWKLPFYSENNLSKLYLYNFLLQKTREIKEAGHGVSMIHMTKEKMEQLEVPVPPLTEQHRIVAKVAELMAQCDRLEAARGEREATRDRFTAASLARLNAPDPGTFHEDARLALDALPALTARADQIRQLRQTILNLAVRGKLVPQDPSDEQARELLKRAAMEIAAYSKANRISESRPESIADDDIAYPAPPGWEWSRLCALFKVITDGDHQPPPKADEGVAFLTIGNITTGRLDFSGCRFVPRRYFASLTPYRTPARGDILYTVVGATYGRPALVETDREFCVQRHIAILKPVAAMDLQWRLQNLKVKSRRSLGPLVVSVLLSRPGSAVRALPLRSIITATKKMPPPSRRRLHPPAAQRSSSAAM
jgi:type I restriction enzyme, S subunit